MDLFLQAIIYKLICWPRLKSLLENEAVREALHDRASPDYCDKDSLFDDSKNIDYSPRHGGILKDRFATACEPFLRVCVEREGLEGVDCGPDSFLLTLCFAFTLLGRRMFYQHAQQGVGRRRYGRGDGGGGWGGAVCTTDG